MTQQIRAVVTVVLLLPLCAAGCEDDAPTEPSGDPLPVIETFVGTVAPASAVFYSFTVPSEGRVSLTLLELEVGGEPASTIVGLGIGSPLGTGCTASVSVATGPGATAQLNQRLTPGIYCAQVSDTGQLTTVTSFALNISRPR